MGTTQTRTNLIATAFIIGGILAVIGALLLVNAVNSQNRQPDAKPAPTSPPAHCLTLSAGALESLQRHLQGGTLILDITAALDPEALTVEPVWYVAATLDDQGTKRTGIWWTQNNPTEPGDNAYLAANATAEVISDYMPAPETSDAGTDAAENCLQ